MSITIYKTIWSAWFDCCRQAYLNGRKYRIDRGSYEGQYRNQLDDLAIKILNPYKRPMGVSLGALVLSSDSDIQKYFEDYLLSEKLAENEQYTYGQRTSPFYFAVARMFIESPNTNQAVIEVGKPDDILLSDPPCLRVLSWKATGIDNDTLQLSTFWRSWNLFAAMPMNLGGLALLNEWMAGCVGLKPGPIVCYSDGAHLYDHDVRLLEQFEQFFGSDDIESV